MDIPSPTGCQVVFVGEFDRRDLLFDVQAGGSERIDRDTDREAIAEFLTLLTCSHTYFKEECPQRS
jgi:hypothetical protein